ncbi:MAG: PAS domain S-box protein [Ktedonobacterales bacterium]
MARDKQQPPDKVQRGVLLPELKVSVESIVELAPDAAVVADTAGRIILVNRQTEVLFGYPREELLGQAVEVLLPEQFHAVHQHHRRTYGAAPRTRPMDANLSLFGRHRDGREFPVEVRLSPLPSEDEESESLVIYGIRDVTELHRVQEGWAAAERARASAEATNRELRWLRSLADTALSHLTLADLLHELLGRVVDIMEVDDATILLADDTGESQTLVIRAARGLEEATPNVRVPAGQGFSGSIAASRAPLIVDDIARFPVFNSFLQQNLSSMAGVPLLVAGRLLGVVHVGTRLPRHFTDQDVQLLQQAADRIALAIDRAQLYEAERTARMAEQQARQEAEVALARALASEEWFRRMADTAPVLLWVSGADALVTFVNARWLGFTGRRLEQELGNGWAEGVHSDDYLRCLETYLTAFRARQSFVMEYRLRRFDGEYRWLVDTGVPRFAQDGSFEGYIGSAIDITEREQLKQEREAAQAREWATSLAAHQMDEFFAVAAHDIRTPVTAVAGNVHLAQRRASRLSAVVQSQDSKEASTAASVVDSLTAARASVDRLVRLTNLLFDVAQARFDKLEVRLAPCDLAAVVREQVAAAHFAAPGRTIHVEVPDQAVTVLGDSDRLGQVLANFLTNALKYSPDDQRIDVLLQLVEGMAVVSVRDRGPGLPPEEQAHLWELFHRVPGVELQSSSGGDGSLGLGLHISKRLVELHHGHVGVESTKGQGATFWFRLPLMAGGESNADSNS